MLRLPEIVKGRAGIFLVMVLISTASWLYVTAAESRVDTFPGRLPLTFKNVPEGFVPVTETETVEVRIRADQPAWSLLSVDSFVASVDLKGLSGGTHELPIQVAVSLPNVQVVEKRPANVRVLLEEQVSKEVPVRVVVQGEAAAGRAPGDPAASPDSVLVVGAKSLVAAITEALAVVTLHGEASDVVRTVRLLAQDREGESVEGIRFEPAMVGVRLPIVQASNARTVGVRVVTTGQPAEGYYVQRLAVAPATVTIAGGGEVEAVDTVPIDLNGLTGDRTVTVDLVLPAGAILIESRPRVTVSFSVVPVPTSKQVPLSFTFTDIDPQLRVAETDPSSGRVVIAGPSTAVAAVNSVTAAISLAGRGAGTHRVPLSASMVHTPEGVTASGTPTPSSVTVTLESR